MARHATQDVNGAPLRLLVVDDDEDFARSLVDLLSAMGHAADAALTLDSAVCACKAERYDLVLLDLRLGDVTGLEAWRRVREVAPDTMGLLMSGYPGDARLHQGRTLGMLGLLIKPLDVERLRQLLARVQQYAVVTLIGPENMLPKETVYLLEANALVVRSVRGDDYEFAHVADDHDVLIVDADAVLRVFANESPVLASLQSSTFVLYSGATPPPQLTGLFDVEAFLPRPVDAGELLELVERTVQRARDKEWE